MNAELVVVGDVIIGKDGQPLKVLDVEYSYRAVTGPTPALELEHTIITVEHMDEHSNESEQNPAPPDTFSRRLESLINEFSLENGSNTPDFMLAEYLLACLSVFETTVNAREKWYGRLTPATRSPDAPPVDCMAAGPVPVNPPAGPLQNQ